MHRPGIAAVGGHHPRMMRGAAMTVHVIPTRPKKQAVVIDAGVPLVGFMEAQTADVAAVIRHIIRR